MPGYTIDDDPGGVLKNKLGVEAQDDLHRLEADYVRQREFDLRLHGIQAGNFDAEHLKALHRHVFQDVYEWAGHTRDEVVHLSDGTSGARKAAKINVSVILALFARGRVPFVYLGCTCPPSRCSNRLSRWGSAPG